ncbi:hypothetical protein ACQKNS_05745 [Peribacillus sp. NPDC094092]
MSTKGSSEWSYVNKTVCDTPAEKLASRAPLDACFDEGRQTVGGK